jgi:prepilin-type N-terminal cleavage/methylation domain-containing protein
MEKNQDKGFTLVELLIVIVILGILATVTVFAVTGLTTRGKESACKADKKTLVTAVEAFIADKGVTPANLTEVRTAGLLSQETTFDATDGGTDNFTYARTSDTVYNIAVRPAPNDCASVAGI